MHPDQYSRWVDPAPLEVEWPRLPWWTMAPRKLLLVTSRTVIRQVRSEWCRALVYAWPWKRVMLFTS